MRHTWKMSRLKVLQAARKLYPYKNIERWYYIGGIVWHGDKTGTYDKGLLDFSFLDNKYIRFCFMNPEDNDKLVKILLDKLS